MAQFPDTVNKTSTTDSISVINENAFLTEAARILIIFYHDQIIQYFGWKD